MKKMLTTPFWILIRCFAAVGIVSSLLMTAQPQFEARWGLDNLEWSWVLLAAGVGGIAYYPANRWLLRRWGSVLLLRRFGVAGGTVIALTPWLPGLHGLLLGIFLQGLLYAGINVAINHLASRMEVQQSRRVMGSHHAAFYLGAMVAALTASARFAAGLALPLHMVLAGMLVAAIHGLASYALVDEPRPAPGQAAASRLDGLGWRLGLMAACAAIAEGGIRGWAAIYLHQSLGASVKATGFGLALFTGAMALGRILCDRLAERFGAAGVVGMGALGAGAALIGAACMHTLTAMLIALGVAGLGMAAVFPLLFSSAGRLGGHTVAVIAGMGALGGLLGPFLLGRIATAVSLGAVMWAMAAVNAAIVLQVGALRVKRAAWKADAVSSAL